MNQISRSSIAIIDTITQRGGFRGEELSTIGQLRDQCAQAVQVVDLIEYQPREDFAVEKSSNGVDIKEDF